MPHKSIPNVIVFGETGAGKSSLLGMLEGGDQATVSNAVEEVTFSSIRHKKTILGSPFHVFDTAGLSQDMYGTAAPRAAIEGLYKLIHQLDDGVGLLVYVMRAPHIKDTARQNYEMFFDVFCKKKVPIVIVITGLEDEENMDQWWDDNEALFQEHGMSFIGNACVTASKGKLKDGVHLYEAEYQESRQKVEKLIYKWHNPKPWKMTANSLTSTAIHVYNICATAFGFEPLLLADDLYRALKDYAGLSDQEAMAEACKIERDHGKLRLKGPVPNVIVFGETGAGKSSILNMLDGGKKADVSMRAKGVTFENTCFEKRIRGSTFKIFDTVGLNEGTAGTVKAQEAIERLYGLIRQLDDGVNLLVYVMRAPRIRVTAYQNYEMFFEVFCQKQVPIVVAITGLEEEESMDAWWDENQEAFKRSNMHFSGFACLTAYKGKLKDGVPLYQAEYEESKSKVEKLIHENYNLTPWRMPTKPWFAHTAVAAHNLIAKALGIRPLIHASELYRALKCYAGLSERDAMAAAYKIEQDHGKARTKGPIPNVVIFGEAGVGKSSIVNALDGGKKADVPGQGKRIAFSTTYHTKTIFGSPFRVFDTMGVDESSRGLGSAKDAIEGLYKLVNQLDHRVNLLVYVMRAPQIPRTPRRNYEVFFETLCDKQVPIVIVLTGLEDEEQPDRWWDENKSMFEEHQMSFGGFACVTATKGQRKDGEYVYQAQYDESKRRLERLIYGWHSPVAWKMPAAWFSSTAVKMRDVYTTLLGCDQDALAKALYRTLKSNERWPKREAKTQADKMISN